MAKKKAAVLEKAVETIQHKEDKRKNIPSAEHESLVKDDVRTPIQVAYERRNRDLDPQLVWRGKDEQDWSDLVVQAPPLYIQERVHPKALINDLLRESKKRKQEQADAPDLFSDFNGLPKGADKTEFYQHDQDWTNRMILGDSLHVMASLAEREGLRGKVQCIYFDPPYGIKFNSNFQWSTTSNKVTDGKQDHITREPEQVKAFRDTWRDGIHSYLTYLRDRITLARDLLMETGSIFIQIGDENVHRVREVLDEVFGESNHISQIAFRTTTGRAGEFLSSATNYILWYAKNKDHCKFRSAYQGKEMGSSTEQLYSLLRGPDGLSSRLTKEQRENHSLRPDGFRLFRPDNLTSQSGGDTTIFPFDLKGKLIPAPKKGGWKTNRVGISRLGFADRLWLTSNGTAQYVRFLEDFPVIPLSNVWIDTGTGSFTEDKVYVVQTNSKVIERCLLMASDPSDLVLDPTCGSGTTAYVAEQWGRRWITVDTSRVALALSRARIMGARYTYFLLADSPEGQAKEAEITRTAPSMQPTFGSIRQGFVYDRVPHIMLKSIANNAEIDVIWEKWNEKLEPLRKKLNEALKKKWQEWEIPREAQDAWPNDSKKLHTQWWEARIARQKEIDASIAAKAEFEYLYDKPNEDKKKVRVAGPFTVESMSPHRMLAVGVDDELIDTFADAKLGFGERQDFTQMILENLRMSGVQQAHKEDRISFTSLIPWPGKMICGEGRYMEGEKERRAAIFVGPEFRTVQRSDLIEAAREAADIGFDILIACAFNFEAHTTEFEMFGKMRVLKARMNADLHMATDLKNTGKGNLFVVFGEPDIDILDQKDGNYIVKVNGVDVFHPSTGKVESSGPDGIACWFIDTDYNEESFFVRHAYFLGANTDPYKSLKTTLKAEIDAEAWATLRSDTSRPFAKPTSGRIAVKVINHLGDEVMKVFKV